jgi:hypothetical protein
MGLIIQQRALQAAGGLRQILPVVRKRDRSLFDQIHRAMNSVVLNIAEADVPSSRVNDVDIALDEVCATSWRLSGR